MIPIFYLSDQCFHCTRLHRVHKSLFTDMIHTTKGVCKVKIHKARPIAAQFQGFWTMCLHDQHYRLFFYKSEKVVLKVKNRCRLLLCIQAKIHKVNCPKAVCCVLCNINLCSDILLWVLRVTKSSSQVLPHKLTSTVRQSKTRKVK